MKRGLQSGDHLVRKLAAGFVAKGAWAPDGLNVLHWAQTSVTCRSALYRGQVQRAGSRAEDRFF
jgi:hypothetical protein